MLFFSLKKVIVQNKPMDKSELQKCNYFYFSKAISMEGNSFQRGFPNRVSCRMLKAMTTFPGRLLDYYGNSPFPINKQQL